MADGQPRAHGLVLEKGKGTENAEDSAAVASGQASAAAVPAVAYAAATPITTVATAMAAVAPLRALNSPAPPGAAAVAHSGGASDTARLPPRSQCDPQRGGLLLHLPGRPVAVDMCMTHPFASSSVAAAAWGTGVSAKAKDALKRDKFGHTGTGDCRFVPLSHETYGRAGPAAFALLHELAEFASSTGGISKKVFMEHAMCGLSTTLCRGIARQVLASAPLQARLDVRPVLPGRPVPTDGRA